MPGEAGFDPGFIDAFEALMRVRRDVRAFRTDPVDGTLFARCLAAFDTAPSVGLSQPWRLVRVASPAARDAARENFETANEAALAGYAGADAARYATLKLSGMREAPEQLAVFCDEETAQGKGLGAGTMPEMRRYSVVCAIMQFWLALRAHGLGLGWVSILDAPALTAALGVPQGWRLVGYLCIGYPEAEAEVPELETRGWERRRPLELVER